MLLAAGHPLFDSLLVAVVAGAVIGIPTVIGLWKNGKKANDAATNASEAKVAATASSQKVEAIHAATKSTNGRTMPETLEAVQRELGDLKREHHNWRQEVGALAQEVGELARTLTHHLTHDHSRRRDDR